ncbi:MAG: DUF2577 domain-containing protein [Negativibacillus sp.]
MGAVEVLEAMKQMSVDAQNSQKPVIVLFGQVLSVKPLQIKVNQKQTIKEDALILTHAVKDYEVDIEVSHYTVNDAFLQTEHTHPNVEPGSFDSHHKHAYKGRKKIKIYNGLKVGENVMMLRQNGGSRYIVLDRIEDPETEGEWI